MKVEVSKLLSEKEKLRAEIAALQNQLAGKKGELSGIERAISLVSGDDAESEAIPAPEKRERARNVKETVLNAVEGAGQHGITVNQLLERTQREGKHLDRGTVSSMLSRFKRDGVLSMVDGKYSLAIRPDMTGAYEGGALN
jgi:cell division septum initiation protein DivIVA